MIKSILREGLFFKGATDENSKRCAIYGHPRLPPRQHRKAQRGVALLFLVVLCAIQDL